MNKKMVYGFLLFVLILAGSYLMVVKTESKAISPPLRNQQNKSITIKKEMVVSGNEFAFSPANITVKRGQTVSLRFKNTGAYPHDLSLGKLNIKTKVIQPGQEDKIVFIVKKAGQYSFTCTVGSHAEKGMTGVLKVI